MDAHAVYEKDYLSKCVRYLKDYNVDNVGGIIKTIASENTISAKAIAYSLSHPFGVGSSLFRSGIKKPTFVDTVFGGCYKREVFEKIGLFNENLKRSQDLEFNLRLKKAGGKILLVPDIVSYYYPSGTLVSFFEHNFVDGIWSILPVKFTKMPFKLRHYIPLLFVSSLLGSALLSIFFSLFLYLFLFISFLYLSLNLYFSVKISVKEKDLKLLFFMPLAFSARHIGYGLGSIFGLFKIFISKPQTAKF
jgi:GT2 family glycosyltransferase